MIRTVRQRLDFIGPFDWAIMGILIGLFIGAVFGSRAAHAASAGVDWFAWLDGFLQNSGTEMLGAFLTFVLLELVRGSREKQADEVRRSEERQQQEEAEERRAEELKKLQQTVADELQKQIRGFTQGQEIARLRAAQTPEERQPILDSMKATGLLERANLREANLAGANLRDANLAGVNLGKANLERANLWGADFIEATLRGTNLRGAHLDEANLKDAFLVDANLADAVLQHANLAQATLRRAKLTRATLTGANLKGATLRQANLEGANLMRANLEEADLFEANLEGATFEGATLPDGTKLPRRASGQDPEPDWRTPFEAWNKAGRPRIEPADDESEGGDQP
jgi:uncharacterized protein YjbI with pentapeptide repeats